jgi:hypothetical protein
LNSVARRGSRPLQASRTLNLLGARPHTTQNLTVITPPLETYGYCTNMLERLGGKCAKLQDFHCLASIWSRSSPLQKLPFWRASSAKSATRGCPQRTTIMLDSSMQCLYFTHIGCRQTNRCNRGPDNVPPPISALFRLRACTYWKQLIPGLHSGKDKGRVRSAWCAGRYVLNRAQLMPS